jgi:hypothetical protein
MIWTLRILFAIVLVSMIGVTSWASFQCALWDTPRALVTHPWFIATLFDTYWGFITFYCWLAYKERSWIAKVAWLIAILLLGNIAMSAYMLWQLSRLPTNATMADVLLRKPRSG